MNTLDKVAFVKAKARGKSNAESAIIAGSHAKNPRQVGWQLSNNTEIQIMTEKAIKALNLNVQRVLQPISDALDAEEKDGSINHNVRLKASQMAQDLIGIKHKGQVSHPEQSLENYKELNIALKSGDDVALVKAWQQKPIDV
jgi:hypothetical protein